MQYQKKGGELMRGLRSSVSAVNFIVICLIIVFVSGCATPAAKAVKRGDELLTAKNYYGASEEYLTALRLESDNKDAKLKLCQTANQAYTQKLEIASIFERSSDFESALPQYKELAEFIDKSNSYSCLSVATVNAKQKIAEMKQGASEKYYKDAENYFNNADYNNAINNYQETLKHNDPYKDCKNKMAESYYKLALAQVTNNNFREAADYFTKANGVLDGYKDASPLAVKYKGIADKKDAQRHYDKGAALVKTDNFRDASEQFEKATTFVANYKDSQALASKYKTKADEMDAQLHFNEGMNLVKAGNFRAAVEQFEKSNSFVSNFKNSQSLSSEYRFLADEKDAQSHYEKGQSYFAQNNFSEAAKEFLAADSSLKGYKDATALAEKSRIADLSFESLFSKLRSAPLLEQSTVKEIVKPYIQNNTDYSTNLVQALRSERDGQYQQNYIFALRVFLNLDVVIDVLDLSDNAAHFRYTREMLIGTVADICGKRGDNRNMGRKKDMHPACLQIKEKVCHIYRTDKNSQVHQEAERLQNIMSSYWFNSNNESCANSR